MDEFKPPLPKGTKVNKLNSVPENGTVAAENMLTMFNVSWVGGSGSSLTAATSSQQLVKATGTTASAGNKLLGLRAAATGKAHSDYYSGALGDPSAVSSQADLRPVASSSSSINGLQHLSYLCPGLHDRDSRQDIARRTFRQLLGAAGSSSSRLVIPLFQRRYCWQEDVVSKWFEDVRCGTRDHLGIHNTGNVVVKYSEQDRGYILIDGQQRVTTCLLLLAAIRDTALQIATGDKDKDSLVIEINKLLFVKNKATGEIESRLLPCLMDRSAYFSLIRPQPIRIETAPSNEKPELHVPANEEEATTFQMGTYSIFMGCLRRELQTLQDDGQKLQTLRVILNQSLDKMGVTLVDILTPVDLAQVFLWLQEKSLMGMGSLLKNDRPGVRFAATDLVRNLLMSPFMDRTLEEQEEVYKTYWQEALEMRFASAAAFSSAVESYINSQHKLTSNPSQFEEAVASFSSTMPNLKDVETYAKFVTIYENRRRDMWREQEEEERSLVELSLQLLHSIRTFLFN